MSTDILVFANISVDTSIGQKVLCPKLLCNHSYLRMSENHEDVSLEPFAAEVLNTSGKQVES
jgi:hypothetical protein